VTYPAGTKVEIRTRNGARVTGTLLCDSSLDCGSQYPVVEAYGGVVYNYRHALVTYPSGRELDGIPGAISMVPLDSATPTR
jgi:hypothetical protein